MINLQNKMAVKVTKKVKYATALYHKIDATRRTFYMEGSCFFQKVHTFWTMLLCYIADPAFPFSMYDFTKIDID